MVNTNTQTSTMRRTRSEHQRQLTPTRKNKKRPPLLSLHTVQSLDLAALADQLDLSSDLTSSLLSTVDNWPDTPLSPPVPTSPRYPFSPLPPNHPPSMPHSPSSSTHSVISEDGSSSAPLKLWASIRRLWDAFVPPPNNLSQTEQTKSKTDHHSDDNDDALKQRLQRQRGSLPDTPPSSPQVPPSPAKNDDDDDLEQRLQRQRDPLPAPPTSPQAPSSPAKNSHQSSLPFSIPSPASSPPPSPSTHTLPEPKTPNLSPSFVSSTTSLNSGSTESKSTSGSFNLTPSSPPSPPSPVSSEKNPRVNKALFIDEKDYEDDSSLDELTDCEEREHDDPDVNVKQEEEKPSLTKDIELLGSQEPSPVDRNCEPIVQQLEQQKRERPTKTPSLHIRILNGDDDDDDDGDIEDSENQVVTPSSTATAYSRPVSDLFEHDLCEEDLSPAALPSDDDLTYLRLISSPPPSSQKSTASMQKPPQPTSSMSSSDYVQQAAGLRVRRNSAPVYSKPTPQMQLLTQSQPSTALRRRFTFLPPSPFVTPPPTPPKAATYHPSPLFPSPMYSLPSARVGLQANDDAKSSGETNGHTEEVPEYLKLPPPTNDGEGNMDELKSNMTPSGLLQHIKPPQLAWEVPPHPKPIPPLPSIYPPYEASTTKYTDQVRTPVGCSHRNNVSFCGPASYDSRFSANYGNENTYGNRFTSRAGNSNRSSNIYDGYSSRGSLGSSRSERMQLQPPMYGEDEDEEVVEVEEEEFGIEDNDSFEPALYHGFPVYEGTPSRSNSHNPSEYRTPHGSRSFPHDQSSQPFQRRERSQHRPYQNASQPSPQLPLHSPRGLPPGKRHQPSCSPRSLPPEKHQAPLLSSPHFGHNQPQKRRHQLPNLNQQSQYLQSLYPQQEDQSQHDHDEQEKLVRNSSLPRSTSHSFSLRGVSSSQGYSQWSASGSSTIVTSSGLRRAATLRPNMFTTSTPSMNASSFASSPPISSHPASPVNMLPRRKSFYTPTKNTASLLNSNANSNPSFDEPMRIPPARSATHNSVFRSHDTKLDHRIAQLQSLQQQLRTTQKNEDQEHQQSHLNPSTDEAVLKRRNSLLPHQRRMASSLRVSKVGTVPRNVRLPMQQPPEQLIQTYNGVRTAPVSPHPPAVPAYVLPVEHFPFA